MSPDYCLRWWAEREMKPPDVDPAAFMKQRVNWRYARGCPELAAAKVLRGDSTELAPRLASTRAGGRAQPINLLFTSPPYYGVTNYHYDQWLRLWMLGGAERPYRTGELWKGKFECQTAYRRLLETALQGARPLLAPDATVYIRTDARTFTRETTLSVLRTAFPGKKLEMVFRPFTKGTQTALFGDKAVKPGEVDIVLQP